MFHRPRNALSRPTLLVAAFVFVAGCGVQSDANAADADLALKRVMLSSGGVGYFEYETQIEDNTPLQLTLRLDQMDDVLKSIVVYDDKGGGATIEMPSRSPLSEIFRNLPVGPESFQSTQDLLTALKGSEIVVDGPVSATGRIISVTDETTTRGEDTVITRHRVGLLTKTGIVQFVLEDAESIRFTDETLNGKVDQALSAIAQHKERDGRTLTVTPRGEGARKLTIAYVVEAPLWKTSYRLVTQEGNPKARLQGWAHLENASGGDWNNVELTLVTGNPVTFRQALYTAYYVNRPEVPVEVLGRILPRADDGAVAVGGEMAKLDRDTRSRRAEAANEQAYDYAAPVAMPPPPPAPGAPYDMIGGYSGLSSVPAKPIAAEASEAATQVIFRIPTPVSAGNGQSLAVPIIDREVPGERIALYQPSTHPRHPLSTVRLVNDTGSGMPPGVITLYENTPNGTAYVGDAQLNPLPEGETRMVSFALDQKVTIDREDKYEQTLTKASLARGILTLSITDKTTTVYTIKAPKNEARSVVLEHPRSAGWSITSPDPAGVEQTDNFFRIPHPVAAGATDKVTVTTELPRVEAHALVDVTASFIEANTTNSSLSEPQRQAFEKMREMRRDIDTAEGEIAQSNAERDRIFEEQKRIRENLAAVPDRSDLAQRYLGELGKQEDELAALTTRIKAAETRRNEARQRLAEFVGDLTL